MEYKYTERGIHFDDSKREKVYCGKASSLPSGYDRKGSPYECMRKGIGVGLYMPDYKRREALVRSSVKGYKRLSKNELEDLASSLRVKLINPDGSPRTKLEMLNEIIDVLKELR